MRNSETFGVGRSEFREKKCVSVWGCEYVWIGLILYTSMGRKDGKAF